MKNYQVMRFWRTIRHLKPTQIAYRIWRYCQHVFGFNFAKGSVPAVVGPTIGFWKACDGRPASMHSPKAFCFLNREESLEGMHGWNNSDLPRLWLYNLHYFDDLLAVNANNRSHWHKDLLEIWITDNPPMNGTGWEPYVLSRRIVNWICWSLQGQPLSVTVLESLSNQCKALAAQLEFNLLGNHLLANAKALMFAGCYYDSQHADQWCDTGFRILTEQLKEQILSDGGHFERSPMYQAIVLEDVIDLYQLSLLYPHKANWSSLNLEELLKTMLTWLENMSHPDGEISFFNDATLKQSRTATQLRSYADKIGIAVQAREDKDMNWLSASGYTRINQGNWAIFFDLAEIGPDYLPGHAHADTLSIEISVNGERLVTNGGTSTYEDGDLRMTERATTSHATVTVDEMNSSEVWGSFRVGRRARVFNVDCHKSGAKILATGCHDGYKNLKGGPKHCRKIEANGNNLLVTDCVTSNSSHTIVGRFPLHPYVSISETTDNSWTLQMNSGNEISVRISGHDSLKIEDGYFASEFGKRIPRKVLVWSKNEPGSIAAEFVN